MNNTPAELRSSTRDQKTDSSRREWIKPEVKSAEVAQATLAGHSVPPVHDTTTCSS